MQSRVYWSGPKSRRNDIHRINTRVAQGVHLDHDSTSDAIPFQNTFMWLNAASVL